MSFGTMEVANYRTGFDRSQGTAAGSAEGEKGGGPVGAYDGYKPLVVAADASKLAQGAAFALHGITNPILC